MRYNKDRTSTGLPGLDRVLTGGLFSGDSVVWQINDIDDCLPYVQAYAAGALARSRRVVYLRFAPHAPLLTVETGVELHHLEPDRGFEHVVAEIRRLMCAAGSGACFVFDSLSDLPHSWCSDQMLGNLVLLTVPLIRTLDATAYFLLQRDHHSHLGLGPIADHTQVLIEACRHKGKRYVRPLKVSGRHSSTLYMLHVWQGNDFVPVTESATTSEILRSFPWSRLDSATLQLGYWSRTFSAAERILENREWGASSFDQERTMFQHLLQMMISRDENFLILAREHFSLSTLIKIRKRMIGTGLIGGKAVGMLLARAILKNTEQRWHNILEAHDSFYIGADVFHTYLVRNNCWWEKHGLRTLEDIQRDSALVRERIQHGEFPGYVRRQFADMLHYFGQSPIIVRSSSLMEDNFENAFSGKYESVFCINRGTPEERLDAFLDAVRKVYASAVSAEALSYLEHRGLLAENEQMALLVQRVCGASHGDYYYPHAAGVAYSFNPYVWSEYIDPKAGMMRLVFGLGTRAVDRSDDDYTRVVALNAPHRRPEAGLSEVREHAQRRVDVLNLRTNKLSSYDFEEVVRQDPSLPLDIFTSRDREAEAWAREHDDEVFTPILTFEGLLQNTPFVADMREMMATIASVYHNHVDLEFTVSFYGGEGYKINPVQCRPLRVKSHGVVRDFPTDPPVHDLLLKTEGPVIGDSRVEDISRIIYVVPRLYSKLTIRDRHKVARLIGKLNTLCKRSASHPLMLLGPGRWGTRSPELGIPVSFADINAVSVLCELVTMHANLVPDVSLGTHFFNDLVEADMLYIAIYPDRDDTLFDAAYFERAKNRFPEMLPADEKWADTIRVFDLPLAGGSTFLTLHADTRKQRALAYLRHERLPHDHRADDKPA
ncbi:MAG: PEP/pyruvate-binding domain-containing protein [Nannocystaceae bacterium]